MADWRYYGRDQHGTRHVPLSQIEGVAGVVVGGLGEGVSLDGREQVRALFDDARIVNAFAVLGFAEPARTAS